MESIEEIYQKHAKAVYSFLLAKVKRKDLAEELTQETFCQAVQSIHRFKGNSSIVTWLCAIANNVWKTYLAKHKNEVAAEDFELQSARSAEQEVLVDWNKMEILKALHNLKEPIREVVYLRLISDLSFKEIGEIMGKSENWARVNYYRGKERIIEEVKKQ